jgi:hypothetical protein
MTDHDCRIATTLDELVPPARKVTYDWERVLADANTQTQQRPGRWRRSRRRLMLTVAVVTLGLLVPVLAVGASQGWWFDHHQAHPGAPAPLDGAPQIIARGTWHGTLWAVIAYRSPPTGLVRMAAADGRILSSDAVSLALITGSLSNSPADDVSGAVQGQQGLTHGQHGGLVILSNYSSPYLAAGALAPDVARIKIILNPNPYPDGKTRTITPRLIPLASTIGHGIHAFVAAYPPKIGIDKILLYNDQGKLLKSLRWG